MIPAGTTPVELPGSAVKVLFGFGTLEQLGAVARAEGAGRALLVSDTGIAAAGHVDRALRALKDASVATAVFTGVRENPSTEDVAAAVDAARRFEADFLIGLGGGSSMDTAKGANFILTNGGEMKDYWGVGKATRPMLPMIGVPTTAGTGSEAQSFALIRDPQTHQKMACGDKKALCRVAILDPDLTATQPPRVAAAVGIDAIAHAVETAGSRRRNDVSLRFSKEAWQLLRRAYIRSIQTPADRDNRAAMLQGAHLAGAAIENSMLGAAHACANPLTAHFNITHGVAVAVMLPHVIRFNAGAGENPYSHLGAGADELAAEIEVMLKCAGLPRRLAELRVPAAALPVLAAAAAKQWTAQFNPRPVGEPEFLVLYSNAME